MPTRPDTTSDDDVVGWRGSDLRVRRRTRGRKVLRAASVGALLLGFVVLLMDVQRDPTRCHQNCFDGSDNTFEAGHVWTAYTSSWQWDAQLAIGWLAFLTSFWALYAVGRRGRLHTALAIATPFVLSALWIVWVTVQPPPGRLA